MIDQVLQKKSFDIQQYKEFTIDIFDIFNEKYLDLCIKYLNDESVPISARYILNYLLFSIEGLKALRYTSHQKFTVDEMVHYYYEVTGNQNFINYLNDIKYFAKEIFILNLCQRLKSNKISQSNQPSIIFIFGNRGSGKTTFIYYALESIANSISELDIPTLNPLMKIPSYLIDEIPKNLANYGAIYINLDVFSRLDPIYLATRVFGYYFTMETVFSHARALTEYVRNEAIKENLNIIDDSSRCSDNRMQELCAPPKGYKQYNFMIISDRNTASVKLFIS